MIPELEEIEVERLHGNKDRDKKEQKRSVSVDMNPMVDLAFLLLTFFMLATTFSKPQAMELLVPAKPKAEDIEKETPVKESKTLSLVLTSEYVLWYSRVTDPDVNKIGYDEDALVALLNRWNSDVEGLVVLIKPTDKSNYGNLVDVLDALNYADVKRYAISELSEFDRTESQKELK